MITRHQPEQPRTRACDQAEGRGRRHALNEELFRTVLSRERKRADRSNQPLVLMLVDVNDGVGADSWSIGEAAIEDRKSTRLNSSHGYISYAVFCLKKKKHSNSI